MPMITKSPSPVRERDEEEIERQSGSGGRGPDHKLPTGGGGDDENWAQRPSGRRGPRERLSRYRLMIFLALVAICMFFVALASAYLVRQGSGHIDAATGLWVQDWKPLVFPRVLWLNSALLLAASAAMEVARREMFHPTDTVEEWLGLGYLTGRRTLPWLVLACLFGGSFLFGQYRAWQDLWAQGVYYGASGNFFYLLTGAHAAHLVVGIVALLIALWATLKHASLETRQIMIDTSAWYWHGMSLVWIGLFALIGLAK